ncbi:restriction endonuclease subunit S [Megasphaera sp. ASD88]|uniref:restriction endonuclease subunit S n=1 Tax=Megasphaera sp. ASD88 TaxID=2027407 RepID=UPI0013047165|nr:restriction endonuclease subunit S [Megasphaera sp. ASD88]
MAKKKELTPEEKLQQALVPKEEQPYPLPEGWKWVRLGDITKIVGGGTPSSSVKEYYEDGNIAWISPSDLSNYSEKYISYGAKNITKLGLEKSSAQLMPKGTVLLSSRAPIGYVAIAKIALSTNQGFKNFLPSPSYLPDYLYWYLKGNTEILKRYASGTTFLELSAKKAALIKFPLAPIEEQKRIVQTIEKYFCRLDKIQEILKSILCDSGKRKSAILHKAFTGELTVKWREENKISFETWRVVSFNEVAAIKSNLVDPKEYQDYPHIAPDNIEKRTGKLLEYHSVREDKVKSNKHRFYSGQILYSKIRPYLSKVIMVDFDGLCSADMYPIEAAECVKYLWYYMLSDIFLQQASTAGSRSVLPKINQKELSKIKTPMPSRQEQERIVYILDHLFAKEEIIAQQIQKISNIIQILKKSILGKAFRGNIT